MATNRLEDIDPAVLSRMDHKVNIAPPAPLERKQILQQYIVKFFSDAEQKEFFTEEKVDEVSTKIEGFTGRAVFKMLNAIVGKKNATKENKLTNEIIDKVVDRFIAQEKEVIRLRTKEKLIAAIPEAVAVAVEPSFSERIKNFFNKTFKSNKLEENDMVVTEAPVADVPEVVAVPVASSYSEKMMTFFNDTFKAKV